MRAAATGWWSGGDFGRLWATVGLMPATAWRVRSTGRKAATLSDVNTTDLRSAIDLGCQALGRLFNPNDPLGAPYFWLNIRPGPGLAFNDIFSDAQVPGKSLLGLLTAARLAGASVDPAVIDRYAKVVFFSYGGPVALPLNRTAIDGKLVNFAPVNVAHGFHGLHVLATLTGSDRAHQLAEASIAAVASLWDPKKGWDKSRIEGTLGLMYRDVQPGAPFIAGLAMAIGPLAKYYQATGSRSALDLATALKEAVLAEFFVPDGDYDSGRLGSHVQNVVYVMASLAWLATATHDSALMARVKAFYDHGLQRIRNHIGWTPEFAGPPAPVTGPRGINPDRGEAGNTALILETALLLGDWGYPDAFADAELMLRSHLLPSQIRDVSWVQPGERQPAGAGSPDLAQRLRGAWGFPAPYGHIPLGDRIIGVGTDIVGPVVYSLAQAQSRIVGRRDGQLAVQLCFDYKSDDIDVTPEYTSDMLSISVRTSQPVQIRIPPWAVRDGTELVGVERRSVSFVPGQVQIPAGASADGHFSVRFPLTNRELAVRAGGTTLRARARGDQIVAMENRGTEANFFEPY